VHGRESDIGTWNGTGYDNDELDAKIKSLASNTDLDARNQDIADIWRVVQDEQLYIPIHHQVLNWGMSEKVDIAVDPEDQPKVKYFKMN
jgi:peptide/nickel transport system substrate-binding protein